MASWSITAYGVDRCSGFCSYCVAANTINYTMGAKKDKDHLKSIDDYVFEKEYKRDWNKVKETMLNDPQVKGKTKEQLSKEHAHFDLWGGDPVTNLKMIQDMVENLKRICQEIGFGSYSFSDSTNGIALLRDDICEWHEKNNVHMQLSHDGLGQWIRTKDIEPLEYENTKLLIKNGILDTINTTTSFYNFDMVKNASFWINYFKGLFPDVFDKNKIATPEETRIYERLYVKLNHIYTGTELCNQKNMMGIWNGKVYEQLKGEPFGDFNFINDKQRAEKYGIPEMAHVLDDYLHSYRMLIPSMGKLEMMPFYSYLNAELKYRFKKMPDTETVHGACRAYQRYRHNVGEPKSQRPYTFVIDTLGNYSECNLLYSKYSVKNPGGVQPAYCNNCKYKNFSECQLCGSQPYPKECSYQYPWLQFLEEVNAGVYRIPAKYNPETEVRKCSFLAT